MCTCDVELIFIIIFNYVFYLLIKLKLVHAFEFYYDSHVYLERNYYLKYIYFIYTTRFVASCPLTGIYYNLTGIANIINYKFLHIKLFVIVILYFLH